MKSRFAFDSSSKAVPSPAVQKGEILHTLYCSAQEVEESSVMCTLLLVIVSHIYYIMLSAKIRRGAPPLFFKNAKIDFDNRVWGF